MTQALTDDLGWKFVVDNRGGAGGVIGSELAANAPKDGYTLLVVSLVNAVNPWLYKLPYDPIKSFAPIATVASAPNLLVVNPELPAKTVAELVALAKQKPGQVQYASGGVGSFQHLGGELFKLAAGVDMLHVPFKGGGPAVIDVIGGHTKVVFTTTITGIPHVRAGKLRALGIGAKARSPLLPEVPTIAEAGVPEVTVRQWAGLYGPPNLPREIVMRLNKEVNAALQRPDVLEKLQSYGYAAEGSSPERLLEINRADLALWRELVAKAGIPLE
jgi:tripartite-type tricarboxylate transporter receptor subunit TctC